MVGGSSAQACQVAPQRVGINTPGGQGAAACEPGYGGVTRSSSNFRLTTLLHLCHRPYEKLSTHEPAACCTGVKGVLATVAWQTMTGGSERYAFPSRRAHGRMAYPTPLLRVWSSLHPRAHRHLETPPVYIPHFQAQRISRSAELPHSHTHHTWKISIGVAWPLESGH